MSVRKIIAIFVAMFIALPARAVSIINDTETENLLTELITPLATAANIPDGRLRVHIVNDDDFNAFVMGGDDVYIYTGLLKQIKTPSALHFRRHTCRHLRHMSAQCVPQFVRDNGLKRRWGFNLF